MLANLLLSYLFHSAALKNGLSLRGPVTLQCPEMPILALSACPHRDHWITTRPASATSASSARPKLTIAPPALQSPRGSRHFTGSACFIHASQESNQGLPAQASCSHVVCHSAIRAPRHASLIGTEQLASSIGAYLAPTPPGWHHLGRKMAILISKPSCLQRKLWNCNNLS